MISLNNYAIIEDIKSEYRSVRENGKSRCEAEEYFISAYNDELTTGAYDDGLLFWIGLAEAQFKNKELSEDVAQKALHSLDNLEKQHMISQADINRCRNKYIQAPMPERKFIKRKKFQCSWNVGDAYAIKLMSDVAKELGMDGKYAVLHKVDNVVHEDEEILPLVRITIWDDLPNPITEDVFYSKKPIKLKPVFFEKNKPVRDKFEYRAQILFTSKKQIKPEVYSFIGHFPKIAHISDELTPENTGAITMLSPKVIGVDCCWYYQYSLRLEDRGPWDGPPRPHET